MIISINLNLQKILENPNFLSILIGVLNAFLNRLVVVGSSSASLDQFQTSLMMQTITPFFCTLIFFLLIRKNFVQSFCAAVCACLIGALAIVSTTFF
jgi:uncharacterized membrane protein